MTTHSSREPELSAVHLRLLKDRLMTAGARIGVTNFLVEYGEFRLPPGETKERLEKLVTTYTKGSVSFEEYHYQI